MTCQLVPFWSCWSAGQEGRWPQVPLAGLGQAWSGRSLAEPPLCTQSHSRIFIPSLIGLAGCLPARSAYEYGHL